ncbi:MAG TPA: DNA starvation/stationary phase protection protein [Candidatus Yaniella excrementigallinarum]|nr:DNA starvation/stationary phase protection protein [Candidatus Yaniella excrementigallinarum]
MTENYADYTTPGMEAEDSHRVTDILQTRLHALNDLHLTLKHAHWNVVGPEFISVHEMLDPQVEEVRGWSDLIAERIATMGASPKGTPGSIVTGRTWEDYPLGRASTLAHISALNDVYTGVIEDFRNAIAESGKVDPMTEDILIEINRGLELFQWFLRSFITKSDGTLSPVTD